MRREEEMTGLCSAGDWKAEQEKKKLDAALAELEGDKPKEEEEVRMFSLSLREDGGGRGNDERGGGKLKRMSGKKEREKRKEEVGGRGKRRELIKLPLIKFFWQENDGLPFACAICRGPFNNPIETR